MRRRLASGHDQPTISCAREDRDGALNLCGVSNVDWDYFKAEHRRHSLNHCLLADARRVTRITKDSCPLLPRLYLLEQFRPFAAQAVFELHEASGVAARSCQAVDDVGADRIEAHREYDRHGAGDL